MMNLKNYETWNLEPTMVVLVRKTPRSWLVYMCLILSPKRWLNPCGVEFKTQLRYTRFSLMPSIPLLKIGSGL